MIRYNNLFILLNKLGMKKSDLREILSPKTVAKLSKGEYISGEAIEKICLFLECQPSDIMEVVEVCECDNEDIEEIYKLSYVVDVMHGIMATDTYAKFKGERYETLINSDNPLYEGRYEGLNPLYEGRYEEI